MALVDRIAARHAQLRRRDQALSLNDWAEYFSFGGNSYPLVQTTMGTVNEESVGSTPVGALSGNSPVFALVLARLQAFSQTRFRWTRFDGTQPGDLFGSPELSVLERPWPNGTTSDLLARMEVHVSGAGNSYVCRPKRDRLSLMRPDRVTIVMGSETDADDPVEAPDVEVVGYIHETSRGKLTFFNADQVAHYAPYPDPNAVFLGMSWITPAIREMQGDSLATEHKARFFTNSATVNLAIKFDASVTIQKVREFKELLEAEHQGTWNAWKTLYLGGGADPVPVGSNFRDMDYAAIQGKAESRLAADAGVPPSWVGFSEGLQGSALNAGNFNSARRRFSDGPQPLDAKILTQGGWATMGDMRPGMRVIGSDGQAHAVLEVFDQPEQDVYRVDFIDGTSAECSLGHSWTVSRDSQRRTWRTLTLGQIMEAGFRQSGRAPTWAIPLAEPVDYGPESDLPLDPYLLGLLLGDGTFSGEARLVCGRVDADETQDRISVLLPPGVSIRREDRPDCAILYLPGSIMATRRYHGHDTAATRSVMGLALDELGLRNVHGRGKFIPPRYLTASIKNRVALLQGLVDSDGCVTAQGSVRFSNGSTGLINGVVELTRSLGGIAWVRRFARGDVCEVAISRLPDWVIPARLLRKRARLKPGTWRRVKSMIGAELVRHVPTRCIRIDSPDSLYITDGFTLTHNTMYHLWTNAASSLETLLARPPGAPTEAPAMLWFDTRVPFMREDAADRAGIQQQEATTIAALVREGYTPESVQDAVLHGDWKRLKHTGWYSVQMQPPAITAPGPANGAAPNGQKVGVGG